MICCAANPLRCAAAGQELCTRRRFKYKPFEWLYSRLDPLLLQQVLPSQQGIPMTLAVLYSSVALRLGIPLLPQRVPPVSTGEATELCTPSCTDSAHTCCLLR